MFFRSFINRLPIGWMGHFVLLRLAAKWRSMLTTIAGVLLVAVIGANSPLYTAAITQVGMIQRLDQQPPGDVHIASRVFLAGSETNDLDAAWSTNDTAVRAQVRQVFETELPGWATRVISYARTTPMRVARDGQDLDARFSVAYYDHWMEAIRIVEGEWPQEPPRSESDLEAALGSRAAARLNIHVNDEIVLDQGGWASSVPVRVRITAIVDDTAETESYLKAPEPLRNSSSRQAALEANLLTTRASFLRIAVNFVPDARSELGWWILFDHTRLSFTDVSKAIGLVDQFSRVLSATFSSGSDLLYKSNLVPVLEQYQAETSQTSTPFELLLLQISALALFFLMATAALVRRGERRETAMLQTRGAFDRQIVLLRSLEALIICILAALAAPFIARQILEWVFPLLTGLKQVPLHLNASVFAYAGLAAGVAYVVLLATLYPVLRLPLVTGGGSTVRSGGQMFWQRYNLDLLFLLVGIAALWRLTSQAAQATETQIGTYKADPLLLLSPVLLFVALGSLLLRFFPGITGLLARALARRRALEGLLASWQVSREPAHYGRITFLMALCVSIGWMATSFQATLKQNFMDRARYSVGADVRFEQQDTLLKSPRVRDAAFYTEMSGVSSATTMTRVFKTNISNDPHESIPGIVLAVNPETLPNTAYWRDDLGELKLPPLPDQMDTLTTTGRELPVMPERIGMWLRIDVGEFTDSGAVEYHFVPGLFNWSIQFWVRLRDATGAFITVPMQPVESIAPREDWVYVEANLGATESEYVPQDALRLDAIYWNFIPPRLASRVVNSFSLALDGMVLIAADEATMPVDWFTSDERWEVVHDSGAGIEGTTRVSGESGPSGEMYRQVFWTQEISTSNRSSSQLGILLNYPEIGPIPAISSRAFTRVNGLLPGATFQLGQIKGGEPWFQLVDTTDYYPTLYPDERVFLVVNQEALLYTLNRQPSTAVYPTEVWLRLAPDVSPEAVIESLAQQQNGVVIKNVRTLENALDELQSDLLSSVGLSGMLYLAFGVALVLSIISLLTYLKLAVQMRRMEFGVLQALGLSSIRVITAVALEQALVMVIGIGLGVILGIVMSDQVLPTLASSASGQVITPPFIVHAAASALIQYFVVMLVVLVFLLATSLMMIQRMSLAQSLRFGEE